MEIKHFRVLCCRKQQTPSWVQKKGLGGNKWWECETWSHAVISSLGARAKGGGRALAFQVARCQTLSGVGL